MRRQDGQDEGEATNADDKLRSTVPFVFTHAAALRISFFILFILNAFILSIL